MLAPLPGRGLQGLLQTVKEVVLGEVWVMERAQAVHPGLRCPCLGPWSSSLPSPSRKGGLAV